LLALQALRRLAMNKDTFLLTLVILVMIAALAVKAAPMVQRLSEMLTDPVKNVRVEQVARV